MSHPLVELGKFTAPDPTTGLPVTFAAEEHWGTFRGSKTNPYLMLLDQSAGGGFSLPEAVVELWQTGQIPVERVPELACAIAPHTIGTDSDLILHIPVWESVRGLVYLYLAITVPLLVMAYFGFEHPGRGRTVMTWPWAIGMPAFGVGILTVIATVKLLSSRSRRRQQMNWLLAYSGLMPGAMPKPPNSRWIFVKNMLIIYAVVAFAIGVLAFAFRDKLHF